MIGQFDEQSGNLTILRLSAIRVRTIFQAEASSDTSSRDEIKFAASDSSLRLR